mgnify:FL=1
MLALEINQQDRLLSFTQGFGLDMKKEMSSGFVEQDAPSFNPRREEEGALAYSFTRAFVLRHLSLPGQGGGSEDGSIGLFELGID